MSTARKQRRASHSIHIKIHTVYYQVTFKNMNKALGGGGTSLYGVVPVAGSPSPLMYYGDYQFGWLCAYTVVWFGTSLTGYNRLVCTMTTFTGVLVMHTTWH